MAEDYSVNQGQSINSLALPRGFFWETIWNHAKNSDLKDKRKDPDILFPGDIVHFPDLTIKEECRPTDATYKFKAKGRLAQLHLVLLRNPKDKNPPQSAQDAKATWRYVEEARKPVKAEPMQFTPFKLYADSKLVLSDNTDRNGNLIAKLPAAAGSAYLVLNPATPQERTLELNIRAIDPITELQGVCKRLYDLGFPCETDTIVVSPGIKQAIADFQNDQSIKVTGDLDDNTRDKIKQAFGG